MIEVNLDDVKALHKGLKKYDKKTQTIIRAYGKSTANTLQNTAKRNAKWTDRTYTARHSIKGTYTEDGSLGTISLEGYANKRSSKKSSSSSKGKARKVSLKRGTGSYRVGKSNNDYFQYLEYGFNGRYKILRPTVDKALPRISKTLANRLAKIKIMEG